MKVKRILGVLLVITMMMLCSGNVFSEQTVVTVELNAVEEMDKPVSTEKAETETVENQLDPSNEPHPTSDPILEETPEPTLEPFTEETPEPVLAADAYITEYKAMLKNEVVKRIFQQEIERLEQSGILNEDNVMQVFERLNPEAVTDIPVAEAYEEPMEPEPMRLTLADLYRIKSNNEAKLRKYQNLDTEELNTDISLFIQEGLNASNSTGFPSFQFSEADLQTQSTEHIPGILELQNKGPMIASGHGHNIYLDEKGRVWTWGEYHNAIYAQSYFERYPEPTKIGLNNVVEVASGEDHGLALKQDGTVYSWGHSVQYPSLGSISPVQVQNLTSVTSIAASATHNLAIQSDGAVWQWDAGTHSASQVQGISNAAFIAAGYECSFAILANGELWAWGNNSNGKLGIGNTVTQNTPVRVKGIDGNGYLENVTYIASKYHTLAVLSDGSVVSWGDNSSKQLGRGTDADFTVPGYVLQPDGNGILSNIVSVAVGYRTSAAVSGDGAIYTWGQSQYGQLGLGDVKESAMPALSHINNVNAVSMGYDHSVALKNDGSIWSVGYNSFYELGIGTNSIQTQIGPGNFEVEWLCTKQPSMEIMSVSSTRDHTLVLRSDGTLWSSGSNADGRLGIGDGPDAPEPKQVRGENGEGYLTGVSFIETGWHSNLAVVNGELYGWGSDWCGQLGNGKMQNSIRVPSKVKGIGGEGYLNDIAAVDMGYSHVIALTEQGKVLTWGENGDGQLGHTLVDYVPEEVPGLESIISVAAGSSHSMVLNAYGEVYTWGSNWVGQLGDGSTTHRNTPVQVMIDAETPLTDIIAISGGEGHSLALKDDGTVWAWGYNEYGQLGLGTSSFSELYAKQVIGLSNITCISAGHYSSYAVDNQGKAYCWGNNSSGQLGNQSRQHSSIPLELPGTGIYKNIVGGYHHAMAVSANGSLYAWGYNQYGQFGMLDYAGMILDTYHPAYTKLFDDYGDIFTEAMIIRINQLVLGQLEDHNDTDCFVFTAPQSGVVSVENYQNAFLNMYDSKSNEVLPVDGKYSIVEGENYYIEVNGSKPQFFDYTFRVIVTEAVTSDTSKTIGCKTNDRVQIVIKAANMKNITEKIFTLTFDANKLCVEDLVAPTYIKETSVGAVAGYPIEITNISPGEIKFKYTRDIGSKGISGILNIVEFKALADGDTTISIEVTDN